MEQETQTPHKRRVRYKGKYPKKFEEKYKELQPEKYQDTIEHVIRKGNTPAGMHISIMVKEILDFLQIEPGEQGFDARTVYLTFQQTCNVVGTGNRDIDAQLFHNSSIFRVVDAGNRFWHMENFLCQLAGNQVVLVQTSNGNQCICLWCIGSL